VQRKKARLLNNNPRFGVLFLFLVWEKSRRSLAGIRVSNYVDRRQKNRYVAEKFTLFLLIQTP
jgi:hypothetical protein